MAQSSRMADETLASTLGEAALDPSWEVLSRLDPEIFQASVKLMSIPKQKNHLDAKIQSLVLLAVDCAATHLFTPGIRLHAKAAASAGATLQEVMEVLELSSTLGIHAANIGIPTLVEVMKEEGIYASHPTAGKEFNARRLALKDDFSRKRGYWHAFWEDFLALDPEFFEAYTEFSSVPWVRTQQTGVGLKPMVGRAKGILFTSLIAAQEKELIYCAFDAAATHLYVSGLKAHMKNAIRLGATPEQIVEVLELATQLSLHTLNVSAPIVQEVYAK